MKLLSGDRDEQFLLKGISSGFDIILSKNISQVKSVVCTNYKSVTNANVKLQVEKQLCSEIDKGHYLITDTKPLIISALGAIPKPESEELRLIHDCSRPLGNSVNTFAEPQSFQFNTIDNACSYIRRGYHMAKIDLKSGLSLCGHQSRPLYTYGPSVDLSRGNDKPTYLVDTRLIVWGPSGRGNFPSHQ